jgi:hypothetical protein
MDSVKFQGNYVFDLYLHMPRVFSDESTSSLQKYNPQLQFHSELVRLPNISDDQKQPRLRPSKK